MCAWFAIEAIYSQRYAHVYGWMLAAVVVDGVDGPLARRFQVKKVLPHIDGSLLDNIIDYVSWTLVPLLFICHAGWLPDPVWLWAAPALITSLYGFVHGDAKQADSGFFRGFPSYWNLFAFYTDIAFRHGGLLFTGCLLLFFSTLTLLPIRFVYPNQAKRFRLFFLGGGWGTAVVVILVLTQYPDPSLFLVCLAGLYPALYFPLSALLDYQDRKNA